MSALAVLSTYKGVANSLIASQDFQWSPTRLLLHGVNPFEAFLQNSPELILKQAPNYLHSLYILFLPLGALPFEVAKPVWATANILLGIGCVILLGRHARLSSPVIALLTAMFMCSTPFRTTISNGQQTLFVLLFFLLAMVAKGELPRGLSCAIAITKYSFAPPLVLALAVGKKFRALGYAAAASLVGLVAFCALCGDWRVQTAVLPLVVSRLSVGPGIADLMTLVQLLGVDQHVPAASYMVSLAVCAALMYLPRHALARTDSLHAIAYTCTVSLLCFKHVSYDYCFLLPMAVLALKDQTARRHVLWIVVAFFWFVYRTFDSFGLTAKPLYLYTTAASCLVLCAGLWAIAASMTERRGYGGADLPIGAKLHL